MFAKLSGNKKNIALNTFYQLFGKLFSMAITIVATVIITRTYGLTGYGEFSLMQVWPALFYIIVDFGINAIATRELAKDWTKAGKYLGNILIIRLLFSLVFIILLASLLMIKGLFSTYSASLIMGIKLSLFLILTQALYTSCNIIFQAKLRYDLSVVSLMIGYLVILVWVLAGSWLGWPIMWVNFAYVTGGIVTFLMSYFFVRRIGVKVSFDLDKKLWKYLFVQSLPLGIMFIFSQLNFKEDAFLLSILKLPDSYGLTNTESAGVYNLPYKVFEVSLVIPTFFMNAVYPIMVRKHKEGKAAFRSLLSKTLALLVVGGIVIGVAGVLLSDIIIHLLGGSEFVQSILVLKILLAGSVLYYISSPLSWLILTLEKQAYLPYIYFVVAILNFVLNFIYIPQYSFYAAAVATHVSEFLVVIMIGLVTLKVWKDYYAKKTV